MEKLMSLQQYVRQIKPRDESYVNHVDRIQDLLSEGVTAQQGFAYEKYAADALKKFNVVPKNFTPAGAGSSIPDLMIQKDGVKAGCELKITAASAGSLVMKYANGNWSIGNKDEKNDEKLFVINLAKEVGLLKLIKDRAVLAEILPKDIPFTYINKDLDKRAIYSKELSRFPELKGVIPATKIEEYYNQKKTYYVNIGTHGFYLLGNTNPLNLSGIPNFGSAASAKYRARVQAKGGGTYQFTFEMSFSIKSGEKSPFNIAPIMGKKNVKIDTDKLKLDWFLK